MAIEEPPNLVTLRAAAGISYANLRAHRDTWAFLVAGHLHKRLTETVEEITRNPDQTIEAEPVRVVIDDRAKPPDEGQ
ncbi:hypothetical protein ACIHCX_15925 [Streptomyces sp. NPDC052043]|uniref:hypothetical protein n=1 Tax=Streptomyces sp. NPDC052043 TaxID=3365684 RepID=UPI0037D8B8B6